MGEEEEPHKEKQTETEEEKESTELISKANDAAERLENANKETERLLNKQEALKVEKTLGGKGEAGASVEVTEEQKAIASAKGLLEGTGFDEQLFPVANK